MYRGRRYGENSYSYPSICCELKPAINKEAERKEKRESETNKKREGSNFRQLCNYTVKGWEESLDVGKRFRHRLTQRT